MANWPLEFVKLDHRQGDNCNYPLLKPLYFQTASVNNIHCFGVSNNYILDIRLSVDDTAYNTQNKHETAFNSRQTNRSPF